MYRRALPGLNASAVGLIVTSVFQLTLSAYDSSPFPTTSICIGMMAYGFTEVVPIPAPIVVRRRAARAARAAPLLVPPAGRGRAGRQAPTAASRGALLVEFAAGGVAGWPARWPALTAG